MRLDRILPGSGFDPDKLITSSEIFAGRPESIFEEGVKTERKCFNNDGIFSPRIFGDMDAIEEYACECGKLHGKFYEGRECPHCGKPVEFVGMTVDKCGWIDLSFDEYDENGAMTKRGNGIHLIQYIAYAQLEKIIGREHLKNIMPVRNIITVDGDLDDSEVVAIREANPKFKYYFIGVSKLYDDYYEILDYYYGLLDDPERYERLYEYLRDREMVFTDKIPVVSLLLRPAMRIAEGLRLDEINIKYQAILTNIEILRDPEMIDIVRDLTIAQIQAQYMQLNECMLDNIKSKEGLIRNQICGARINFSARNIISPAKAGYKIDEIVLPYLTFVELYRFEIIQIIRKIKQCTYAEAEDIWFMSTLGMNEEIYKICQKMISDHEVGVLLNRNPTIAYGSILYLRVAAIKHDYDDNTMSIHNCILTGLAADYDGDVLNLISVKDKETREVFKNAFSPKHLLIDPNTGRFNDALNLERDQVLGLNNLLH